MDFQKFNIKVLKGKSFISKAHRGLRQNVNEEKRRNQTGPRDFQIRHFVQNESSS